MFVEPPKFKVKNLAEKKMQVLRLRFLTEIDENAKSAPPDLLDNPQTSQALEILEEPAYSEAEMLDYERYWNQVRRDKALMDDLDDAHAKLDAAVEKFFMRSNLKGWGYSNSPASLGRDFRREFLV